jgi:hypothetical protein
MYRHFIGNAVRRTRFMKISQREKVGEKRPKRLSTIFRLPLACCSGMYLLPVDRRIDPISIGRLADVV